METNNEHPTFVDKENQVPSLQSQHLAGTSTNVYNSGNSSGLSAQNFELSPGDFINDEE